MKWYLACCLAFFGVLPSMQSQKSSAPTIGGRLDVWKAYRVASENKETGDSLSVFEDAATAYSAAHKESPEALGMVATAELMKVESMQNLLEKLEAFLHWKAHLETAIESRPMDPDLRVFRLSVQLHVPGILAYSGEIDEDVLLISNALHSGNWSTDLEHETFIRDLFHAFDLTPELDSDEHE